MSARWLLLFSPPLVYTCATCISWGGAGAGNNSITGVWQTLPPSSSAPIPASPSSGHSQRTCSLPSGMWMCIMEMDGGWLCHTVEQTDSSLNACLPASISLSPTAPPGIEPGLNIGPAQVCVGVCVCVWLQQHVINIFCIEKLSGREWQLLFLTVRCVFGWTLASPLSADSLSKLRKSPCTTTRNAEATHEWENRSRLAKSLFCKEISHSPLGACIAIVCCAPPTPSLLRLQLLSCAYSSAETWSLCVQRCVCLYALYKRLYYLPVPHALVPFLFSLSGWVHTRCRQVQSLCSPSTDTQSCLIKLLDQ